MSAVPSSPPRVEFDATVELTNSCVCMWCPECSFGTRGDERCDDCRGPLERLGECFGCYDEDLAYVDELVAAWAAVNPAPHGLWRVDGRGMGWRRTNGHDYLDLTQESLSGRCAVNAAWTQRFTVQVRPGGELSVCQSHHDAMGELYTVRAATLRELVDDGVLEEECEAA